MQKPQREGGRHPLDRPAFWIVATLLFSALTVAIFSGDLTIKAELELVGGWLRAVPGPTQHWASILSAWAWPVAALVIVYWLRLPLTRAAGALANRFGTDDLDLWGLKMTSGDSQIPLDRIIAAKESSFAPEDVEIIERLYEFAGDAKENAGRLEDWISKNVDPRLDPIDFLSEPVFARERQAAYEALVEKKNG
jgi:hypothetical protein